MNRETLKQEILQELLKTQLPLDSHLLSERLNYTKARDFKKFLACIVNLEAENKIKIDDEGYLFIKEVNNSESGRLRVNNKGYGFVTIETKEFFIPKDCLNGALDGDLVSINMTRKASGNRLAEGEVSQVLEQRHHEIIGIFYPFYGGQEGYSGTLQVLNDRLNYLPCLVSKKGLQASEGEVVKSKIIKTNVDGSVVVSVTEIIGHKDAPGSDVLTVLNLFGIPHEFPDEVKEEAKIFSEELKAEDYNNRKDYRELLTMTIDGADAKDLDDAISLQSYDDGSYELYVHIADVSAYVKENSAIDQEAYRRGTSVYLVNSVVPMLPQRLSNKLCSLQPEVDRLTMTCRMHFNKKGNLCDYAIEPSVIRSNYRLTYDLVNRLLEMNDYKLREDYSSILSTLDALALLHQVLLKERETRGALDFDTTETVIEVNNNGEPTAVYAKHRGLAERMIESFMLAANETVAKHFMKIKEDFLYRVHDKPEPEKLAHFIQYVTAMGVKVKGTSEQTRPKELQQILSKVGDEAYSPVVKMLLLRSMQQARYAKEPLGHYGLASKNYTHFTSPIRRYPDLIVHRLIRHHLFNLPAKKTLNQLNDIAQRSSQMERRSVDAEREIEMIKKVAFMKNKVGEEFTGIISAITNFGFFVRLENTIEGLVHLTSLQDDYYTFIEDHILLLGQRTGRTFRLGDAVIIKVSSVNELERQIDFILIEHAGKKIKKQNEICEGIQKRYHKNPEEAEKKIKGNKSWPKYRKNQQQKPFKIRKKRGRR